MARAFLRAYRAHVLVRNVRVIGERLNRNGRRAKPHAVMGTKERRARTACRATIAPRAARYRKWVCVESARYHGCALPRAHVRACVCAHDTHMAERFVSHH